jgi:predicted permease
MVAVAHLLGFHGDLATALVILALLPVAQTAFVVAQQYDASGAAAVSVAMVASLLLMLPQLMVALKVLQWSQLLQA